MGTLSLTDVAPVQRAMAGAVRHLATWLDHHTGGRPAAPPRPAHFTYLGRSSQSPGSPLCLACGRPVEPTDEAIAVRGDLYHAACGLYQPRARAS